jgi:hypothetical protein
MEQKTAQLRVKHGPRGKNIISAYGCSGQIFWETPSRARFLIDTGSFELVNAEARTPVGATEVKPAGPSENKESLEKKSSAADPAGPSTDSAPSSESGTAAEPSSSAGDLVSPDRKSTLSRPRARRGRSSE